MSKKNIKVLVAAHKKYWMPSDEMYLPLHVGHAIAKQEIGFQGDDSGENISAKNANYCELTGIYWAWKNLDADYIGLVHYRRYISNKNSKLAAMLCQDKKSAILTSQKAQAVLEHADVIVPARRNYYIETLYSHYEHTHDHRHLDITGEIIQSICPEYYETYKRMLQRKSGHMFNMFVMSKEKCDEYCSWLFPILNKLEQRVDFRQYDKFQQRMFGRISELLLNVWIEQKQYRYKSVPVVNLEKNNLKKRIPAFLKAKFLHKRYKGSF